MEKVTRTKYLRTSFIATFALATAAILGLPLESQALTLQFFGQDNAGGTLPVPNSAAAEAAFLSHLTGVGTETFENAPPGTANGFVSTFSGAGSATFTGNMSITAGPSFGTFPISGTQQVEGFANAFSIAFSKPVAAFGFYATDVGDQGGSLKLSYANGPATVIQLTQLFTNNGNALYFGYISTENPFTGVTFSNSSADDRFGYDNMTIGSVQQVTVPDSGTTIGMLGLAFAGIAGLRRKFGV